MPTHRPKAHGRQQVKGNENALKVEIAMLHERIRKLTAELDKAHGRIAELEAR